MNNAELIKALRCEGKDEKECLADECEYFGDDGWCDERKMALDAADALEAAEKRIAELEAQLPKEGEWIKHGCEEDQFSYCECPFCGFIGLEYHYCPNCGARMQTVTDCHTLEEGER